MNYSLRNRSACLAMGIGLIAPTVASAELVTFTFGGVVTFVDNAGFGGPLAAPWDQVVVGDPWVIQYMFEADTPDSQPVPVLGSYSAVVSYSLTVGSVTVGGILASPGIINVFDSQPAGVDQYEVTIFDANYSWFMQLDEFTDTAFSSDALKLAGEISLPIFTIRDFAMEVPGGGSFQDIAGSVDFHSSTASSFGIEHTPLGVAGLSDNGGLLSILNIGSSGKDGVSINVGETLDLIVGTPFDPTAYPVGSFANVSLSGLLNGAPNQSLGSLQVTRVPSGLELLPDYNALGISNYSLSIYNGSTLLFSDNNASLPVGIVINVTCNIRWTCSGGAEIDCTVDFTYNSVTYSGTRIEYGPGIAGLQSVLANVSITGTNLGSLTINDEAVPAFSQEHRTLHNSTMLGGNQGASLEILNVGACGLDGVCISSPSPSDTLAVVVDVNDPIDLSQAGQSVTIFANSVFDGGVSSDLGSLTLANNGLALAVTTNFDPVVFGSAVLIEMYNNGAFVGSALEPAGGIIGDIPLPHDAWDRICSHGITSLAQSPTQSPGFVIVTPFDHGNFGFLPASGAPELIGDEIRFIAPNAVGAPTQVGAVGIRGVNLGNFTIVGALSAPVCPADFTGDGNVNASDLAFLLSSWGTATADLNGDGQANSADLAVLLGTWGVCP